MQQQITRHSQVTRCADVLTVDEKCALIAEWMAEGRLAKSDPAQLILSIWAITQHYADFDAQIRVLVPGEASGWDAANAHVETLFRKLLTPETTSA